ncbi:polyketide synthase [Paecilomyces variotii No. 5]|uniref:Polyketide synthase n=1 Tax=Byssochlamys spectabilis (strain No. 5 / NBRC 109023) TaxID=1356009 RepID=V5FKW9_BYSSN|nr:polyketide synthase [Paecilomyces variotii No. 5]
MASPMSRASRISPTPSNFSLSRRASGSSLSSPPPETDPAVIVGLACRVPGAQNPSQLWQNIEAQKDLRQKMPSNRFNVDAFYHPDGTNKGTTNAKYGYFLDQDIADFDAGFFHISGKEAEAMDPQQRLLLEVVYEALENAGITLDEINGSQTSVFCGCFTNDYNAMTTKDLEYYPKYSVTGTGNSILANRISYFYNLHGPSATIDTACSSSLVCFHMGTQSLRNNECDISIVVGSALHFDPNIFVTMTDLGMLSVNGRCATFDASGSGYVRGEGICAAVLKRQSQAEYHGDRIRAVVRASATNHDGTKQGITLPSSIAQEDLIRRVYNNAGLNPADTQYFEAHGTGTARGDPIETRAIGAVFSESRKDPLYIGSVKSNIGHLEGASGLAGIIKTTMALESGKIPPNMHFKNPNPEIKFDEWKLSVPQAMIDWPSTDGLRRASINSFGYGGTNAHIVLEAYQPSVRASLSSIELPKEFASMVSRRPVLLPLTSHSENAGKLLVSRFANYLKEHPDRKVSDVAVSLSSRRSLHQQRSFAIGRDRETVMESLNNPSPNAKWTAASKQKPRLGFVFTGQGGQWFAMGRQLIQQSPLFKQTLERCDTVLQSLPDRPDWSVIEELLRSKEESRLSQTRFSQPICTALQLAILDLLKTWNIEPSAVVGHSSGEMATAYAAGILSFENAMIAAYYRGLYMSNGVEGDSAVRGSMMAVGLTEMEAIAELKSYQGKICIAAVNSPSSMTLSGDEDAIVQLKESLTERKIFARQLQVAQAFHSHHMLPLAPAYEKALNGCEGFAPQPAKIRMFSSVTARLADPAKMGAEYWTANMTGAVRFSDALTGILLDDDEEKNVDVLVEIGPHPALKGPARQVVQSLKLDIPYIASLTRGVDDYEGLLTTAGQLFQLGYPVNLEAVNSDHFVAETGSIYQAPRGQRLEDLPSYAWDHKRYWSETRFIKEHRLRSQRHSVLGAMVPGSVAKYPRWRNYIRQKELPWLSDHVVDGKVIFPAAGYISMAIEAVSSTIDRSLGFKEVSLRDVVVKSALILDESDVGSEIILELRPATISAKSKSDAWYEFVISSYDENQRCTEHCCGLISIETGTPAAFKRLDTHPTFDVLQKKCTECISADNFYQHLWDLGLQYGKNFSLLTESLETGPGFALGSLAFQPSQYAAEQADLTIMHPTLLDASFHVIFAAIESIIGRPLDEALVPTFIRSFKISGSFARVMTASDEQKFEVCSFTRLPGPRVAISDLLVADKGSDEPLLQFQGLEVTSLGADSNENAASRSLFFRTRWQPTFDLLKSDSPLLSNRDISEIVDIFAHQHPDSAIIHFTSSVQRTRDVLRYLGGTSNERRRFKSITPVFSQEVPSEDLEMLAQERSGLIDISEPKTGEYDLVIVSDAVESGVSAFVREGGYVITDGQTVDGNGLTALFTTGNFTTWRKEAKQVPSDGPLTIIMPSQPSERTRDLAQHIKTVYSNPSISYTSFATLADQPARSENVVVLSNLDEALFFDEALDSQQTYKAVQSLLTSPGKNIVWVLESATLESSKPEHAMIVGLARVARSENDQLRLVTLDMPAAHPNHLTAKRVIEVLDRSIEEDEIAEREGSLFIPRVEADDGLNSKLRNGVNSQPRLESLGSRPLALKIGKVGLLETLVFEEDDEIMDHELADDEIEIEVKASAINFRDIAASMGIIEDFKLGDECSGVVLRVGSKVDKTAFDVGDRVVAWRPGQGAHRTVVRNPASLCYKLGPMPFAEAAALPLILTTAYYSLVDTARLQSGEYVLIHSAAGGVGQMAIQIAQMIGANVIATVGSQAKRDLLKSKYGLRDEQIFSSRDDSFVQGVMSVTGGRGVDVALNSLAGKLLHATWSCMAAFGRFIEIGKRDIHENTKIDMDPFRKSVTFASVDLITMFERNKVLGARVLQDCCKLVHDGHITPPESIAELPYSDVIKAFRLLQMGKHTGKVVLVPHKEDVVPVRPATYRNKKLFDSEKTYLLVGGLGGLGRTLAEWMVRKGARNLAFFSRSGAERAEAKATVDWLQAREVQVSVYKGDVAKYADVESCIRSINNLGGVFQAAMVLQDAPFDSMTHKQWQTCTRPKVLGAYNLHKVTLDQPLDFFICFSSASGTIGSKGQANYSSANAYLDALMRHRREIGLSGSTMNCGMIIGVGAVAENQALQKVMERIGYDAVNKEELLYQIEEAVASDNLLKLSPRGVELHQTITGLNLSKNDLYWSFKPLFRNLYSNNDFNQNSGQTTAEERTSLLLEAFIEKIAAVLAVPADTIQPSNPLSAYGLDSIVAVEFRKWFAKTVGVDLALFDVLGAASIIALVNKAVGLIKLDVSSDNKEVESVATQAVSVIPKADTSLPIPMSTFQSRLWFLHNFAEDKTYLNLPVVAHLKGKPDIIALRESLDEMKRRNPILRTCYFEGDDFAEQMITEDCDSRLGAAELDIEEGDVLRVTLVNLGNDEYALVFICHHIAIDRGSAKSFLDQMTAIYDGIKTKKDLSIIPKPQVTYSDFTPDIAFWKEKLAGIPSASKLLPFAKSERPLHNDYSRSTFTGTLKTGLLNRLKRVCSQSGATPFQFLLTAFRAFLFRYTEEKDLTILVIDGNRPHPDVEDVLGFFVNMTPIRCQDDCEASFDQLLEAVKGRTLEAMSHSNVPFDTIVDVMQVEKTTSHFPLGQVVVNYQMHGTFPVYRTQDYSIHDVEAEDIPSACELNLEALEDPEKGLNLRLEYSTTFAIRDHRQPIDEIKTCGPKEIELLKQNYWGMDYTPNQWNDVSVCQKILENAEKQPAATAITTSDGEKTSYGDLVERAQRIAFSLKESGIKSGQRVGLLSKPGIDAITAMVGILYNRCCYVSLDPEFASSLASLATDVVSKSPVSHQLMEIGAAASAQEKLQEYSYSPKDPFYMIYTSGSTGKPKGVLLTQANTQQMLATLNTDYKFTAQDNFLHQSSICFDLSVVQIFSALTAGAQVCVATAETRKDPIALADFMRDAFVSVTYFTPTQFALLLEHNSDALRKCKNYRVAYSAGERLPVRVAKAFYDLGTPATLYNTWSPSELVVQTSIQRVEYPAPDCINIPIGLPMANCRHYVLDSCLNPLPVGFIGELCVGGAQVGAGYLNRPEVNARSFVTDPFCSDEDRERGWNRLFRTGDRGRFLPDGRLEFHGRIAGDKQIKLRGFRIDLGEVEQMLYRESFTADGQGIVDISVVARTVNDGSSLTDDRQLVAYVVTKRPLSTSAEKAQYAATLQSRVEKHLNAYMLPNGYQFLDSLPVTIGGKVDRQNLLNRELSLTYPSAAAASTEAPTESKSQVNNSVLNAVISLFKNVLNTDRDIEATDNFFQLGGQSILLLRLQSKVKRTFKVNPKLQDLLRSPTPLAISEMICSLKEGSSSSKPSAPAQEINWEDEVALPNDRRFNVPYGVPRVNRSDVVNVLLTGAESFIGIHMLATILSARPQTTVFVLGTHQPIQHQTLKETFEKFKLFRGEIDENTLIARTRCVDGCLAKEQFGLTDSSFDSLARSVHSIYHLASEVSLLKTYRDLKAINTTSVLNLIQLARRGDHLIEINHLSTWSVPHLQAWNKTKRTRDAIVTAEESAAHFTPPPTNEYGYFKARWAAEMLLTEAAERGFPVSIYRAAAATGSTATGVSESQDDFIRSVVMNMIQHKLIPQVGTTPEFVIDFVPVNYLAATMYDISSNEEVYHPGLSIYHIGNKQPLHLNELPGLLGEIRGDGSVGQAIPLVEWLRVLAEGADEKEQLRWAVTKDYFMNGHTMFALDRTNTDAALDVVGESVDCPRIDVQYLRQMWQDGVHA